MFHCLVLLYVGLGRDPGDLRLLVLRLLLSFFWVCAGHVRIIHRANIPLLKSFRCASVHLGVRVPTSRIVGQYE